MCCIILLKIPNSEDSNCAGHSRKMIGEATLSNTYPEMSENYGKRRKRYVDYPKYRSKLAYIIHEPVHSSDKCKVLGDFCSKYSKIRPTKGHGQEPANIEKFNRKQDNNAMFQHVVDDTSLQEENKLSTEYESHENIDSEIYKDDPYEIEDKSLDKNKENR